VGGVLKQGLVTLVLTFIAAQVVNWAASEWLFGGPPPVETDQQVVQIFKHASQVPLRLALTFTCVVAAPLVEELLYRGFIYGIAKHLAGPWPATLFSAVLFSLAHQNLMAAVPLCVLGLGFAISYERTKSLWVPMLAHALFNAWNLAALAWGGS
jgi:membrane protease YdiL (CAAX protease family)